MRVPGEHLEHRRSWRQPTRLRAAAPRVLFAEAGLCVSLLRLVRPSPVCSSSLTSCVTTGWSSLPSCPHSAGSSAALSHSHLSLRTVPISPVMLWHVKRTRRGYERCQTAEAPAQPKRALGPAPRRSNPLLSGRSLSRELHECALSA